MAGRDTCDYYESYAPPPGHQSATDLPTDQQAAGQERDPRGSSHVHS